jgi:hypothetical protein
VSNIPRIDNDLVIASPELAVRRVLEEAVQFPLIRPALPATFSRKGRR